MTTAPFRETVRVVLAERRSCGSCDATIELTKSSKAMEREINQYMPYLWNALIIVTKLSCGMKLTIL